MEKKIEKLMIVGAMDCETDLIFEAAGGERLRVGGYEFAEGPFASGSLIVAKSLMGMANAAACTMAGILRFAPDAVIVQGTAGAHGAELHQGDIVLSRSFVNIGRYRSPRAAEGEGVHTERWEPLESELFYRGGIMRALSLDPDPELLGTAASVSYDGGRLVCGVHGSGDVWNTEADRIIQLRAAYGSDCEEMEGFAVAQVCAAFDVPVLGIRIISNSALQKGEDFDESFAFVCQRFVLEAAKRILA